MAPFGWADKPIEKLICCERKQAKKRIISRMNKPYVGSFADETTHVCILIPGNMSRLFRQ
jgi:hypothetical protein